MRVHIESTDYQSAIQAWYMLDAAVCFAKSVDLHVELFL
jgi:hypothetical protein